MPGVGVLPAGRATSVTSTVRSALPLAAAVSVADANHPVSWSRVKLPSH